MISYDIMPKENQILVRVNDPMDNAVEEFAEDRDYTKAEASRKILESRLKGEGYLRRQYGNDDLEPLPDGGQVLSKLESIDQRVDDTESLAKEVIDELEASGEINRPDYYLIALQLAVIFILSALSALLLQMGGIL
jgi:hypothetical protein